MSEVWPTAAQDRLPAKLPTLTALLLEACKLSFTVMSEAQAASLVKSDSI